MPTFKDYVTALTTKQIIEDIVGRSIEAQRPSYRYAIVQSIDRVNRSCQVVMNGDPDTAAVPCAMGSIQPSKVGQVVRIDGLPGDRFIQDVMGPVYLVADSGEVNGDLVLDNGTLFVNGNLGTNVDGLLSGASTRWRNYATWIGHNGWFEGSNGTTNLHYILIGRLCFCRFRLRFDSSGTTIIHGSGNLDFRVPFMRQNSAVDVGTAILFDAGTYTYQGFCRMSVQSSPQYCDISTADAQLGVLNGSPFTFGHGDFVDANIFYEVDASDMPATAADLPGTVI